MLKNISLCHNHIIKFFLYIAVDFELTIEIHDKMLPSINIDKVKEGDQQAFRKLFEFLYPKLIAHACRFVDEQIAKDLVQDLFTSYWTQKEHIKADNLFAFLYKSLHNRCLDYLKHQNVVENYEAELRLAEQRALYIEESWENNETLEQIIAKDIHKIIEASISELPPRCAEAFRLYYFKEMSHKEIAEYMKISNRTVETHIHQATSFLRNDLKDVLHFFLILLH